MNNVVKLLLVPTLVLSGCATRAPSDRVFNEDNLYQTPEFSITSYKSPELRSLKQLTNVQLLWLFLAAVTEPEILV